MQKKKPLEKSSPWKYIFLIIFLRIILIFIRIYRWNQSTFWSHYFIGFTSKLYWSLKYTIVIFWKSFGWNWQSDIWKRQADVKIDKKDFKLFHVCFSSFLSNYYYYLLWLVFGKIQKKYFITHRKCDSKNVFACMFFR